MLILSASAQPICETCSKATRRRNKLKMVFKPMPGKSFILPRERYGIDFYGLHDGEILVIVDLFSKGKPFWSIFPTGNRMASVVLCCEGSSMSKASQSRFVRTTPPNQCKALSGNSVSTWTLLRWSQAGINPEEIQFASV